MRVTLSIIGFLWLTIVNTGNSQQTAPPTAVTVNNAIIKIYEQKTDSLKNVIEKRQPIVDNNQEDILQELKTLRKKFAERPVRVLYRTKIQRDTVFVDQTEYMEPDTVYITIHDTIEVGRRPLLSFKKSKKQKQQ